MNRGVGIAQEPSAQSLENAESQELLDALAICDEAAWRWVDVQTRPALGLFVRRQGADAGEVEDVVNECYAHMYEAVLRRREIQSIAGYLFGIARFVVRKRIRERVRRRSHELNAPEATELANIALDAPLDIQRRLAMELRVDLREALDRLTEYQREVLLRCAVSPHQREVAAELGVSYAKLRKDLHLARRELRELLGRGEPDRD